jgi:hypothetical protein
LYNTSFVFKAVSVLGNSKLYVWSAFRVRTVDYFGSPLSGANTTIIRGLTPFGRHLGSKLSDENGWASFQLFSYLVNSTGSFAVGDIQVYSAFSGASARQNPFLSALAKDEIVALPLPSWSGYILPVVLLVAVIAILSVVSFVLKKLRKQKT